MSSIYYFKCGCTHSKITQKITMLKNCANTNLNIFLHQCAYKLTLSKKKTPKKIKTYLN